MVWTDFRFPGESNGKNRCLMPFLGRAPRLRAKEVKIRWKLKYKDKYHWGSSRGRRHGVAQTLRLVRWAGDPAVARPRWVESPEHRAAVVGTTRCAQGSKLYPLT